MVCTLQHDHPGRGSRRQPAPSADVDGAMVAAIAHMQEQEQLQVGGQATAQWGCVCAFQAALVVLLCWLLGERIAPDKCGGLVSHMT